MRIPRPRNTGGGIGEGFLYRPKKNCWPSKSAISSQAVCVSDCLAWIQTAWLETASRYLPRGIISVGLRDRAPALHSCCAAMLHLRTVVLLASAYLACARDDVQAVLSHTQGADLSWGGHTGRAGSRVLRAARSPFLLRNPHAPGTFEGPWPPATLTLAHALSHPSIIARGGNPHIIPRV